MTLSARLPWWCLLGMVILVPVVVGVFPLSGAPITLNVFVEAKLVVLCLTLAVTLASWVLVSLRSGSLFTGRALWPLAIFATVATVSTMTALDPRLAIFGDFEQGVGLIVFLSCALVCYLTAQLVRDKRSLGTLTTVVVVTATGVAIVGLMQQLLGFDLLGIATAQAPEYLIRRGYGTIGNADTYAAYLVLPALLAFAKSLHAPTRKDMVTWGVCFLAILTSGVASQTRGPFIGLVIALALYLLRERMGSRVTAPTRARSRTSASPAGVAGALILGGIIFGVLIAAVFAQGMERAVRADFIARFGSLESLTSLGGRIPLWTSALRIAAAHPLLGVGPDSFRLGWYPTRPLSHLVAGAGLVITDPHSVPLLILATMGVLGLLATLYLAASTLVRGYLTAYRTDAARDSAPEYAAWLYGTFALLITFLTSLLTSVLVFMAFLAFGVLIAPSLRPGKVTGKTPGILLGIRTVALATAVALTGFAVLTGVAQVIGVTSQVDDADLAATRAARAASLTPWDSQLLTLKYQTMVQSALDHVFTGKNDGESRVTAAADALENAARREPLDYQYPYRTAVLLIGSGEKLGEGFTRRGIEAGRKGLELYPNSLELRTGIASGYLQLGNTHDAAILLSGVWDASPTYLPSGLTYVKALMAQHDPATARRVLDLLKQRFPQDPAVSDLDKTVPK